MEDNKAERLRKTRGGATQTQMAWFLGVSERTVRNFESEAVDRWPAGAQEALYELLEKAQARRPRAIHPLLELQGTGAVGRDWLMVVGRLYSRAYPTVHAFDQVMEAAG